MKVLFLLQEYPQLSETYMDVEIKEIAKEYEVRVLTARVGRVPQLNAYPYQVVNNMDELIQEAKSFSPDIIHSHWLTGNQIHVTSLLSKVLDIPYTLRAHSFDVLGQFSFGEEHVQSLNSGLCLGIVCLPFSKERLVDVGINPDKIHKAPPVVDVNMFYNESTNGRSILANGACLPKKRHQDFIQLAKMTPDRTFNIYPIGYDTDKIVELNKQLGNPANIFIPVEHESMPVIYKRHEWLVYPACYEQKTVGWSAAILEAQASGVGICMANIRPDLRDYVGEGGYLYNSLEEAREIIRKPFPDDRRQLGFENAKKFDFRLHKRVLTDLWSQV